VIIFAVMESRYYSIRMHAGRDGNHLSGAERLVPQEEVETVAMAMLQRAGEYDPSSLKISVDEVDSDDIVSGALPNLTQVPVSDVRTGREKAIQALLAAGVTADVAVSAIETIAKGASPDGGNMRGAMLIDAGTGARLEPDQARGIRATRMDILPELFPRLEQELEKKDLAHHRTREALILAAKVLAAPGIIAELCWSDDPQYTAGYVAAPGFGYLRIPHMKEVGDPHGGRAFFCMPGFNLESSIRFLEETPFLADRIGLIGDKSGG